MNFRFLSILVALSGFLFTGCDIMKDGLDSAKKEIENIALKVIF